jgi:hypothetical protein
VSRNKPRKWSNLKGQLPDDPEQVQMSPWMEKVLTAKDARQSHTMQQLQDEWVDLEQEEAFASLAEGERNIKYEALERRILEELERVKAVAGTDMWRGESKTFSPQFTPRPVVDDPAKLLQWIKDTKQEALLTLPAPRLKSLVCEALDTEAAAVMTPAQRAELKAGEPASGSPPPGVSVYLQTKVHHTTVKSATPPTGGEPEDGPF